MWVFFANHLKIGQMKKWFDTMKKWEKNESKTRDGRSAWWHYSAQLQFTKNERILIEQNKKNKKWVDADRMQEVKNHNEGEWVSIATVEEENTGVTRKRGEGVGQLSSTGSR